MERLARHLTVNAERIAALSDQRQRIIDASESDNADDEHDPEGTTIAYEREQVTALLQQARRTGAALQAAMQRAADGGYGVCEHCGGPIGEERLEARPWATTCIGCAR